MSRKTAHIHLYLVWPVTYLSTTQQELSLWTWAVVLSQHYYSVVLSKLDVRRHSAKVLVYAVDWSRYVCSVVTKTEPWRHHASISILFGAFISACSLLLVQM